MNRLALMVLENIGKLPGLYGKLCHYAKHTDKYPEAEKWRHIQQIMRLAANSGNVDLRVYGKENIPKEGGFMLYGNHQGMFDVVALAASCDAPLGAVYKKELKSVPVLKEKTHLPVLIDPSHATGVAKLVKPMAMAATACGADGLMIEVHNDPKNALCDGAQSLTPEQFADVVRRVRVIRDVVKE